MKVLKRIVVCVFIGVMTSGCGSSPNRPRTSYSQLVGYVDKSERPLITAARVSEQTGDYRMAVDYFRKLYEKNPDNLNSIIGLSRNLRYGNEGAKARLFMDMIIERGVDGPGIRAEYGKAQLANGLPDRAVGNLNRAISLGEGSWQTFSALGTAHDRLDDHLGAQKAYETALQISPENPLILNNQALSLALSGQLKLAINVLKKATSHPGATPKLRQNLALLHALDGDLKAAKLLGKFDLSDKDVQKNLKYYRAILNGKRNTSRR